MSKLVKEVSNEVVEATEVTEVTEEIKEESFKDLFGKLGAKAKKDLKKVLTTRNLILLGVIIVAGVAVYHVQKENSNMKLYINELGNEVDKETGEEIVEDNTEF